MSQISGHWTDHTDLPIAYSTEVWRYQGTFTVLDAGIGFDCLIQVKERGADVGSDIKAPLFWNFIQNLHTCLGFTAGGICTAVVYPIDNLRTHVSLGRTGSYATITRNIIQSQASSPFRHRMTALIIHWYYIYQYTDIPCLKVTTQKFWDHRMMKNLGQ